MISCLKWCFKRQFEKCQKILNSLKILYFTTYNFFTKSPHTLFYLADESRAEFDEGVYDRNMAKRKSVHHKVNEDALIIVERFCALYLIIPRPRVKVTLSRYRVSLFI